MLVLVTVSDVEPLGTVRNVTYAENRKMRVLFLLVLHSSQSMMMMILVL